MHKITIIVSDVGMGTLKNESLCAEIGTWKDENFPRLTSFRSDLKMINALNRFYHRSTLHVYTPDGFDHFNEHANNNNACDAGTNYSSSCVLKNKKKGCIRQEITNTSSYLGAPYKFLK